MTREPDVPSDHLLWLLRHADRNALLSIEAYERSHDLTDIPGHATRGHGGEHVGEEDGQVVEEEEADLPTAGQRGTQVVPPSMR